MGIVSDLSQRKEAEEKLKYLANYDRLTGLAIVTYFMIAYTVPLARARTSHRLCNYSY